MCSLLASSGKAVAFLALLLSLSSSCNNGSKSVNPNTPKEVKKDWLLTNPEMDDIVIFRDSLSFNFETRHESLVADSTEIFIDGKKRLTETLSPESFSTNDIIPKVGRQILRLRIFYNDSSSQTFSVRITVLADTPPVQLSYKVIDQFPHDISSFTQGYFYHEGYIYEGTGRKNRSKIRKIDPENGEVLSEVKMDPEIFGEGITLINEKIYQLTYQNKVGFVYDFETLRKIREFDLQTFEGWGLTDNEKNLIVSEGSSLLYFYDPEYFNQVKQLDVATDQRLLGSLNELEYAKGSIWANVYGQSFIVKIDETTGKVLANLDLNDLFPKDLPRDYDHVLNGIAYNPDRDSYYVTGKYWPVVYEIKILE